MAEEMVADEFTARPRRILIIFAGASHSIALLCTCLTLFLLFFLFHWFMSVYIDRQLPELWNRRRLFYTDSLDLNPRKEYSSSMFDFEHFFIVFGSWRCNCLLMGTRRGWTVRSRRRRGSTFSDATKRLYFLRVKRMVVVETEEMFKARKEAEANHKALCPPLL